MKIFYILISLVVLVNVLEAANDKLMRKVIIANDFIEQIREADLLPRVIVFTLLDEKYTMKHIAFMFVVPGFSDGTEECLEMQIESQMYVFSKVRNEARKIPNFTYRQPDRVKIEEQYVPYVTLAEERRNLTNDIIKAIIRNETDSNYRIVTTFLCRLMGLFRSLIDPGSFIIQAYVDNVTAICTLVDVNQNSEKYKCFDGKVRILNDDDQPSRLFIERYIIQ